MAPNADANKRAPLPPGDPSRFNHPLEEEVVISGIAGRWPESDNIDELAENLFNHVDMITEDDRRWTPGLFGLPRRSGKIKDLSKFDNTYFGVHGKQANMMDPQARLLLETTYEALIDAGLNPNEMRGSNTGVYIGSSVSEVEEGLAQDVSKVSGYALTGCSRSMFANRISYVFDFRGPSYAMDTACSSSFLAFQQAILGLRSGQCDMAIVGGTCICVRPVSALQFHKLNMLSMDGKCKYLDAEANGYVRSETVSVCVLQKASDARRIYATVVHAKTNTDGYKDQGITFPSWMAQRDLLAETYDESGVDPNDLVFVEAHGTGTKAGDPQECRAIADVICARRRDPLPVGGVKSNLGHAETSSGMCSLAKVLIAFAQHKVPANLHFNSPNMDIEPLVKGLIKPITENMPIKDGLVGINSFGFGGVNVHVILKSFNKQASPDNGTIVEANGIPRLIFCAGRTAESCEYICRWIRENPEKVTREFLSLLQNVYNRGDAPGLNHRAYMLVKEPLKKLEKPAAKEEGANAEEPKEEEEDKSIKVSVSRMPDRKPLYFVYAGMGSQWTSMAKGMMKLDVFARSINKSADLLKPFGIDLIHILCSDDSKALDCMVAPFVAIAAVQIALTDVLFELGIVPDGIIGHSVGELGCAYADGCFNHEQMLLSAYWRGKCVEDAKLPRGLMAAVGLSWEEAKRRCPEGVVPACHNSSDSVTISGSYEATKKFVDQLSSENIFARVVNSSNTSFHSYFMNPIGPTLLKKLQELIPNPKERTSKWICSSIPESRWGEDLARFSAPEYYVNNLVSPVLFAEAWSKVPENANCIEVAPHSLLQAIIKRNMSADSVYIPLMKRNNNDANVELMFSGIGQLYQLGYQPKIELLYPRVQFPVSNGTQSLSSLVKWDHNQSWIVTQYPEYFNPSSNADYTVKCDINENEDEYIADHCLDGRILYPATGYLILAWKMLAKCKGQFYDKFPVIFENVTLHRATILTKTNSAKFVVRLMETSGDFSVSEGGTVIVSGRIFAAEENPLKLQHWLENKPPAQAEPLYEEEVTLSQKEIYKELRVRGYDYGQQFQGLQELSMNKRRGKLAYNGKWICFADAMLQMSIMSVKTRAFYLPVRFQSIRCDPQVWKQKCEEAPNGTVEAMYDPYVNVAIAPGLEIRGLKCSLAPRNQNAQIPSLESYQFVPNTRSDALDVFSKKQLAEYSAVCCKLIEDLLQSSTEPEAKTLRSSPAGAKLATNAAQVNEKTVTRYTEAAEVNGLIGKLKAALAEPANKRIASLKAALQSAEGKSALSEDQLANVYTREYLLRPYIDLVLENLASTKFRVLEVNPTTSLVHNAVQEFMQALNSVTDMDYTVAQANPPTQILDEDAPVKICEWNVARSNMPSEVNNCDLIIYKDVYSAPATTNGIDYTTLLTSMYDIIRPNGFALALMRTQLTPAEEFAYQLAGYSPVVAEQQQQRITELINKAKSAGFSVIGQASDAPAGTSLAVLLRKVVPNPGPVQSVEVKTHEYDWLEKVKSIQLRQPEAAQEGVTDSQGSLWLLADDTPSNGIVGLINCLRQESGGARVRAIFNQTGKPGLAQQQLAELSKLNLASNVISPSGQLGTYRHLSFDGLAPNDEDLLRPVQEAYLNVVTRGDLTSLRWFESANKYWNDIPVEKRGPKAKKCTVYYAPLNFRDIMLATGKLPPDALPGDVAQQDCIMGLEFSGRDDQGRRVMGMVPAQSFATSVVVEDPEFLWPIPDQWTMEEAATVPVVYGTAYYALVVRGELREGESVLIHSAAGGVGQAAIAIALSMGCRVFATVGSQDKRDYLKKLFPQLTDDNFANSRDTSFEQHILRHTNGLGVDVVLNSLSEEKLQASVRALGAHGRFLEIGKYDLSQNNPLGMSAFLKNIAFHGILLDALFVVGDKVPPIIQQQKKDVARLIREGIASGAVRPLRSEIYERQQVEQAFRYMASGKHIGKVIVKIRSEEPGRVQQLTTAPAPMPIAALPRTAFHPRKTYIVTGGLGGFGLELSNWLVVRGARHIVLTSRTGPRDSFQRLSIERMRQLGAQVLVYTQSVMTVSGAERLIKTAQEKMGAPVGGIFNLAMVLRDALLENQTVEGFEAVCGPKVQATINLDVASRKLCADTCDYFVAFSSVSCGRGNLGQANYGFANSSMERVCEQRRAAGLHGVAIQWGAIGDVGVVTETMSPSNDVVIGGTYPQRMPSCLATMDKFLASPHAVCSSIVKADRKATGGAGGKQDLLKSICNILGVKPSALSSETTLGELGMDSLMGVEVKQTLERDYETIVSIAELRNFTVSKLIELCGGAGAGAGSGATPAVSAKDLESTTANAEAKASAASIAASANKHQQRPDHGKQASPIALSMPRLDVPTETWVSLNNVKEGEPVLVIPPLEGIFDVMDPLMKKLDRPAFGLNWSQDFANVTTIQEAASRYIENASKIPGIMAYDIIGYSFGTVIAFEMALQLQAKNKVVRNLILLDGSPSQIYHGIEAFRKLYQANDANSKETQALVTFIMQHVPIDFKRTGAELMPLDTKAKLKRVVEIFKEKAPELVRATSAASIEQAASAFMTKMLMMLSYRPARKFDGNCLLVRAEESLVNIADIGEDYNIGQDITGKAQVHASKGDHTTFIVNELMYISRLVNSRLLPF